MLVHLHNTDTFLVGLDLPTNWVPSALLVGAPNICLEQRNSVAHYEYGRQLHHGRPFDVAAMSREWVSIGFVLDSVIWKYSRDRRTVRLRCGFALTAETAPLSEEVRHALEHVYTSYMWTKARALHYYREGWRLPYVLFEGPYAAPIRIIA